jgi:hypothetical protein
MSGEAADPPIPTRHVAPASRWSLAIATFAAAAVLFSMLGWSGIWDPYELDAADLARRIAVNALHTPRLALADATNTLPTLTDLRMGELPFTSMALGFRAFGMHDWSGRLPLALWAFAGAMALYGLLARLVSRRAGLYAVLVLVTMPLFFMQARTMLGDAVTMAALVMAFAGLTGAMLDDGACRNDEAAPPRRSVRLAWFALGLLGLGAGYLSRGLLIGVAIPACSVGFTWILLRVASGEDARKLNAAGLTGRLAEGLVGGFALLVGVVALGLGVSLLLRTAPDDNLPRALGFALLKKVPVEATFDLTIRQLGHALFPWSAFLPFALGRLFRAPIDTPVDARDRETGLRLALLVGAGVAFAMFAFLGPYAGPLPFSAPAILAAIVALAVVDLERGAPPSPALALGTALLAFVLYRDLVLMPDKALAVFAVDKAAFPKSFEIGSARWMGVVAASFAGLVGFAWLEEQPAQLPTSLRAWFKSVTRTCREGLRELGALWGGNLVFALLIVEAALIGLAGMLFIGRSLGWGSVMAIPKNTADLGVNLWWALPLALGAAAPLWLIVRDAARALVATLQIPRAAAMGLAAITAGGVLSFAYFPALAAQLSPKGVFESYARLRQGNEPLGLVGVRSRAAAYYSGGEVRSLSGPADAFAWLTEQPTERRWLITEANDLPKLNSLYRAQHQQNLPVLDGRSSQILLVSNELGGHPNESWLDPMFLREPPTPAHVVSAEFDGQLEALGWDILDKDGKKLASVVPQTNYRIRFYYRVLRPITGSWKAFIHIDGFQRRFNGDHAVLDGKYPMSLWQVGDMIVDDYDFQLEPNFTPGSYTVYYGFFSGDTRFKVTRGPNQDNRINGGALRVR